jgi:hypothetical protein
MDKMTTNSEERPRGARLPPHPPERKERGYRLYEQGKSNPEIAAELGIPLSTIHRWSSKGKWKLRKQLAGRPGTELGAGLVPSSSLTDEAEQRALDREKTLPEAQDDYEETMQAQALRIMRAIEEMPDELLIANADRIAKLDLTARKALKLDSNKPRQLINIAFLSHGVVKPARIASDVPATAELTYEESTGCKPAAEPAEDAAGIPAESSSQPALPAPPIVP